MPETIVQKYGGSSVGTPERMQKVARRIVQTHRAGKRVVVVVSAMGDTTDRLIARAEELSSSPSDREMDMLMSTGEQVSIALLTMTISGEGEEAVSLTGPQAGVLTDGNYGRARILNVDAGRISAELDRGRIVVVAGFQGMTDDGEITTLGRGGSDASAVAIAAALDARCCEIYTDVDGVFTADPSVEPRAVKLEEISYREMLEMATLGAQVLQPRAVEFAHNENVQIYVASSFNSNRGTMVKGVEELENMLPVSGVTHDTEQIKISLRDIPDQPGVASRIFTALAEAGINVDMIIQNVKRDGVNDISFTIESTQLAGARDIISDLLEEFPGSKAEYDDSLAKVSIVGAGMISNPGVAARMFAALGGVGINIEMISTSEIKISCLIAESRAEEAVQAIHAKFELDRIEDHISDQNRVHG